MIRIRSGDPSLAVLPHGSCAAPYDSGMPTGTEGESRSPWGAPTDPPVAYLAGDRAWAEALPDPATDPDPTGELPVISSALPTPVRYRRSRQRLSVLVAIIVPCVVFAVGLWFVISGTDLDSDSPSTARSVTEAATGSVAPGANAPPLATAAVVVEGDPVVVAIDLSGVFVTQLRAGQYEAAAALTHGEWTEGQLRAGYGTVATLQNAVARVAPIGPDTYYVRMVFVQEPTDPAALAVGRCEQWEVSPSGQVVIPLEDTASIDDPLLGLLRGQPLMTEMARVCAAMSIG